LANALATSAPADNPAVTAAAAFDVAALADALGRPDGFADATAAALAKVKSDSRSVLALALASPDLAVA
jgi:hypothetical protein